MRRFVSLVGLSVVLLLVSISSASATRVKRWGSFFGTGESLTVEEPTAVEGLKEVTAMDASNTSAYFLEANGTEWAIGNDNHGQLGDGGEEAATIPVQVQLPAGIRIKAIGEAGGTGYAIGSNGEAFSWGAGALGSLCLGPGVSKLSTPAEIPGIANAVAVQGGEDHVLFLLANGTVMACGTNTNGQLGIGTEGDGKSTVVPVPGLTSIVEISAGNRDSCALSKAGEVYDWGFNDEGQIGAGSTKLVFDSPLHVSLPGPASEISCGGDLIENSHTLALVKGQLYGWGCDNHGQVGDGQTTDKLSPVATGLHFSRVVASGAYSLGLDASGNVWSWGSRAGEGLGRGFEEPARVPAIVDTGATGISATAMDSLDF